ncbi:MAG: DUF4435 domain-containing protein [Bryobacterales bacterium]|nr:DUF4435 domain-containing protein [Bryobacterales bacterium]
MSSQDGLLVVEGPSDARFWRAPGRAACDLVIADGKSNVVKCIERLDAKRVEGVLGVVDDDYASLKRLIRGSENAPESENLVTTEVRDLECLLWRSSAFETVLAEYGDPSKIAAVERTFRVDIRTRVVSLALVFGGLRCAAQVFDLDIDVSAIKIPQFLHRKTWTLDIEGLWSAVVGEDKSIKQSIKQKLLSCCTSELRSVDPWLVIRGHDVTEIMRLGLKNRFGDRQRRAGADKISTVLRTSFRSSELRSTRLWMNICNWQDRNPGFSVVVP